MSTFTSNFLSFVEKTNARKIWLLELDLYDPNTTTTTTYYYSSEPYNDGTNQYVPRLKVPLEVSSSIYSGNKLGGRSIPDYGDIVLVNVDEGLDFIFEDGLAADGRDIVVKLGGPSLAYADFGTVFEGTAQGVYHSRNGQEVIVKIKGSEGEVGEKTLQTETYMGIGQCLKFDPAADTRLTHAHSATLNPTTALTLEALVFIDSDSYTSSQTQIIVGKVDSQTAAGIEYELVISSGNKYVFRVSDGTSLTTLAGTTNHSDNTDRWVRISGTYKVSTTTAKLYVDGELEDSTTSAVSSIQTAAAATLRVGSINTVNELEGRVCDIRVWVDTERTQDEIRDAMHRELTEDEWSDTTLYWRLNDGEGTSAGDDSGNALHGTIVNEDWQSTYEGNAELAGKPKPICFGRVQTMQPVFIDRIKNLWQFHYTTPAGVDEVWAGGYQLAPDFTYTGSDVTMTAAPTLRPDWGSIVIPNCFTKVLRPGQTITITGGTNAGQWTVAGSGLAKLYVDKNRVDTTGTFADEASGSSRTIETTPGEIEYYTDELKYGCIRLVNATEDPIQIAARGYRTSPDLTKKWAGSGYLPDPYTTADIVEEILTVFGEVPSGDIDSTSFSALNTANSKGVGYSTGTEFVTVGEVVDKLLQGVGAWWGYSRNGGKLTLGQIVAPIGNADVSLTGVEIIQIDKISSMQAIKSLRGEIVRNFAPIERSAVVGVILTSTDEVIQQFVTWLTNRTFTVDAVPDPTVVTTHPTAIEGQPLEMYFTGLVPGDYFTNSGKVETQRQYDIFKEDRDFFRVVVKTLGYQVELGDIIEITLDEFGLSGGQKFMLVSTKEDATNNRVEMVVWG